MKKSRRRHLGRGIYGTPAELVAILEMPDEPERRPRISREGLRVVNIEEVAEPLERWKPIKVILRGGNSEVSHFVSRYDAERMVIGDTYAVTCEPYNEAQPYFTKAS